MQGFPYFLSSHNLSKDATAQEQLAKIYLINFRRSFIFCYIRRNTPWKFQKKNNGDFNITGKEI